MRPGEIAHYGKMMGKPLIDAEVKNVGQVESRTCVLIKKDALERLRKRELHRRSRRDDGWNVAKVSASFQSMIYGRAIAHAETSFLEERCLVSLRILEQATDGEANTPVITSYFRNSITTTGNEASVGISLLSCCDRWPNEGWWNTLRSERCREAREKL